ncbi:hypothetical protein [Paraburkholderia phytofirmans]|uniref:hypothetical protein n=1 Tax=Paraburkholderia phytofirmans TaxID=261302 RepID=UPI0038B8C20D
MTNNELDAAISRVRVSRDKGVQWLLAHIAADGEPVGAKERNGWGRVPWALAVAGEGEAAARVIAWAESSQLAHDGGFAPGPAFGSGRFGAYPLAHFAIGAWLTERFGTSLAAMDALRRMQDPATGGLPIGPVADRATDVYDLLSTAQVGLAAVITGQDDVADLAYRWVVDLIAQQPIGAEQCFYSFRRGPALVTEPAGQLAWLALTDFSKPRQSFYTPGMAAVFLSSYAQRRKQQEPLRLATRLLQFNVDGCAEQFQDPGSVQVCKFGWGAATMLVADPEGGWLRHVHAMGEWFIGNQHQDGAWAPSSFLSEQPGNIDKLVKTAEHVMEVNAILTALGTVRGRG